MRLAGHFSNRPQKRVDGGTLITDGATVQPGGFTQAVRRRLGAQPIDSRSSEFSAGGADHNATESASPACAADLAVALGEAFRFSEATDHPGARFIADKSERSGRCVLIGVVVACVFLVREAVALALPTLASS